MIPWKRDELVRNFKNNFTTDRFLPFSPNASDEAKNLWARTSNLQWSEDGEGNVERGSTRVKERRGRWQNGEKREDFDCFTLQRG